MTQGQSKGSDPRFFPTEYSKVHPGDVLLVEIKGKNPLTRIAGRLIKLGARLTRQTHRWNHVIVASHIDDAGIYWGVQGQPGVVGWVDLRPYLKGDAYLANEEQPKTEEQRKTILDALTPLVGKASYDWTAIAVSAGVAAGAASSITSLWRWSGQWGKEVPGALICSALADYGYERAGLATPKSDRYCTPADWATFIERRGWA